MAQNLLGAAIVGLMYVALEPFVRRRWPQLLVSWNRLLSGRVRDPRVGSDLLIGAAFGVAIGLAMLVISVAPGWFGWNPPRPIAIEYTALSYGVRGVAANYFWHLADVVGVPMIVLFMAVLLRAVLRKTWLALTVGAVLVSFVMSGAGDSSMITLLMWMLVAGVVLICLVRFGLVATMSLVFFQDLIFKFPLTLDLSAWYVGQSALALVIAGGVAVYAFVLALGGRPVFQRGLLDG